MSAGNPAILAGPPPAAGKIPDEPDYGESVVYRRAASDGSEEEL